MSRENISMEERLKMQMDFIREVDKAKSVFRQTYLTDGSRKENDAEHSWHLAGNGFFAGRTCPGAGGCA